MKRKLFTLKMSDSEIAEVQQLATLTERTVSDAIRYAVRQALRNMGVDVQPREYISQMYEYNKTKKDGQE